jgi:hypothetical protein
MRPRQRLDQRAFRLRSRGRHDFPAVGHHDALAGAAALKAHRDADDKEVAEISLDTRIGLNRSLSRTFSPEDGGANPSLTLAGYRVHSSVAPDERERCRFRR